MSAFGGRLAANGGPPALTVDEAYEVELARGGEGATTSGLRAVTSVAAGAVRFLNENLGFAPAVAVVASVTRFWADSSS